LRDAGALGAEEATGQVMARLAAMLTDAGFPRMPARVFVALLCTDSGRLTASELAAAVQGSAGAVSGAVRYLVSIGLVDREHLPGSRKDLFRVRPDAWHAALVRRDAMVHRFTTTLAEGVAALGPETPAGQRLAETRDFFAFWQREMPALLERWEAHRSQLLGRGNTS
jgi:DNA-binding transcriptional regulator GbsR (MarR family)